MLNPDLATEHPCPGCNEPLQGSSRLCDGCVRRYDACGKHRYHCGCAECVWYVRVQRALKGGA